MLPTIVYEDEDFLVLHKPAGMTVNTADTTKDELTMQQWVEQTGKIQKLERKNIPPLQPTQDESVQEYNIEDEFASRGGIVHRLDKETSGILLVAKHPQAFGALKNQFMDRTVKKTYQALAHGKIAPVEGEINAPIGRQEFNRMRFGVVAGGREAVTRYRVLANYQFRAPSKNKEIFSLVELYPQTGRTHQIRVHLKYINHPIVADPLYAGRKVGREDRKYVSRLFLHASRISLLHPRTHEPVSFECPLAPELQTFLDSLQQSAS